MKNLWLISLFVCMVNAGGIQANDLNADQFCATPVERYINNLKEKAVRDTSENKIVLLPFNTGKQELSPAISNGYLYYYESSNGFRNARIFKVNVTEIQQSVKKRPQELEVIRSDRQQYQYLNFTPDGKMVLLNAVKRKAANNNLFIGSSDDVTTIEKLIPFPYNSKEYSIGRATISPDGNLLVFSSDKPQSIGKVDLWACKLKNGEWQTPVNLGSLVNTTGTESMPFFFSNTRLCFASDGHKGFGGFDLFYTDVEGDSFTLPVNMGLPINSKHNESGICYCTQNGLYYFASDRRGNYDIYSYRPEIAIASGSLQAGLDSLKQIPVVVGAGSNDERNATGNQNVPTEVPQIVSSAMGNGLALKDQAGNTGGIHLPAAMPGNDATSPDTLHGSVNHASDRSFYAVQVMAITPERYAKRYYLKDLDTSKKYYVVREDGLIKIRTGDFSSYQTAFRYVKENKIKEFYIVRMAKGQISEYL